MGVGTGFTALALIVSIAAAGCGFKDPSDNGEIGGPCYPTGTCDVGLACSAGLCVPADAAVDAAVDTAVDGGVDAPVDALVCSDVAREPNNTLQTATGTDVDGTQLSRVFTGSALCPNNTDEDYFVVMITTASRNLEMLVDFGTADPMLTISILNSGGIAIANGVIVTSQQRLRAYAANLPTGTFYGRVREAGMPAPVNTFTVTFNVTGP